MASLDERKRKELEFHIETRIDRPWPKWTPIHTRAPLQRILARGGRVLAVEALDYSPPIEFHCWHTQEIDLGSLHDSDAVADALSFGKSKS